MSIEEDSCRIPRSRDFDIWVDALAAEGADAYAAGASELANPYTYNINAFWAWADGWKAARSAQHNQQHHV